MNSIEWIDEQIEEINKTIEHLKIRIIEDKEFPSLVKGHMEKVENITQLKELFELIKSELEAWYVVKPNLRFEEHSHAWIYLDRIPKDDPSYSVIEKNLLNNKIRTTTVVTKEGNKITVRRGEIKNNE
jgi:hypothetical protein